jgi:hypothetical protein
MLAGGAEPMSSGRPRLIRVARRRALPARGDVTRPNVPDQLMWFTTSASENKPLRFAGGQKPPASAVGMVTCRPRNLIRRQGQAPRTAQVPCTRPSRSVINAVTGAVPRCACRRQGTLSKAGRPLSPGKW